MKSRLMASDPMPALRKAEVHVFDRAEVIVGALSRLLPARLCRARPVGNPEEKCNPRTQPGYVEQGCGIFDN